jgi:colicin import membrane protein
MAVATLYEDNVKKLLDEKKRKLQELEQNPQTEQYKIDALKEEIGILTMLYENYASSMGAFRRTKGAREHR